MEGAAMPPGGLGPRHDTVFGIWFSTVFIPCFGGTYVGIVFALRADGPPSEAWSARIVVPLFLWLLSFMTAGFNFRELRRRGKWLPPLARRSQWLGAALYAAVILSIASTVVAGFAVCVEFLAGGKT
jgi:hypothetical protein